MKNFGRFLIFTMILGIILTIIVAATPSKAPDINTKALMALTAVDAAGIINNEAKNGWDVKFIMSQTVATSVGKGQGTGYNLKGDILIVFEKRK